MMIVTKRLLLIVIMVATFGIGLVNGQTGETDRNTINTINRLETQTERFRKSVIAAFDGSEPDRQPLEDDFIARIGVFGVAADRLRDQSEYNEVIISDVEDILRQGLYLELMSAHLVSPSAMREWAQMIDTLDNLAQMHDIVWVWDINKNPNWRNVSERRVFDRLKNRIDEFRVSFDAALAAGCSDDREFKDNANVPVKTFEETVHQLEDRVNRSGELSAEELESLLGTATAIDKFMRTHNCSTQARRDWARIRANLDELALLHSVIWRWRVKPVIPGSFRR